ncbi:MAG: PF20097 family protein [Anaerolineae bacterium]
MRWCPECGSALEDGFLGYGSGLLWHEHKLRGWRRIFLYAVPTGHFVLGSIASSPFITSVPARKCTACGTVVLPRTANERRT